jgi:MFS family permease
VNRQLLLLALAQGFFLVNNVTFIAINGLAGLGLAPVPWMATLPVMGYVAGGALSAPLAARHQRAWGRRRAFQVGLGVAMLSTAVCALAVSTRSFWLLVAATVFAGYYNANAALYRFAATELVEASYKERAISWVLAGGILGAVVGPNLASATRDAFTEPFAGAYAALVVVALLALAVVSLIRFPPLPVPTAAAPGRSVAELARQPVFVVAVAACALGYGVMNLLMAATPIAMSQCAHPFSAAALVLEWHVLAMFVPSFFTGNLIRRVGVMPILWTGVALNLVCIAVALSGTDLMQFTVALVALGLGWNFLYVGGTALFTEAYKPQEKTTAQAAMDTTVFATMTLTSFASGALVTTGGWTFMNVASLVPVGLLALALLWLVQVRRRASLAVNRPSA